MLIVRKRINEWGQSHPWRTAAVTGLFLFAFGTVFGIVVFDRGVGVEAAVAATYAVTFSVLTGAINSYRKRRDS